MIENLLVGSSEPERLRALGKQTPLVEKLGGDFLCIGPMGTLVIQRKTGSDLYGSVLNGRLNNELNRARTSGTVVMLLVEENWQWTLDGHWYNGFGRFTFTQYRGLLYSCQHRGIWVEQTHDISETENVLRAVAKWWSKKAEDHKSLSTYPNAPTMLDGVPATRDERLAFALQALVPGIGPKVSRAVVEHFDRLPLHWAVGQKAFLAVPGVGKERAKKLFEALR